MVYPALERRQGESSELLKEYRIHLGVPIQYKELQDVRIDAEPHIFWCRTLYLLQPEGEMHRLRQRLAQSGLSIDEAEVPLSKSGPYQRAVVLERVLVMLGHGIASGQSDEQWTFLCSGKPVSETVMAYHQVAQSLDWPPIDVILACRPETSPVQPKPATIRFTYRKYPSIYPDTSATIVTNVILPQLVSGEGVTMVVRAGRWSGIDRWLTFWDSWQNRVVRQARKIPDWATLPKR